MACGMILNKAKAFGKQIIAAVTSYAATYCLGEPLFWIMGLRQGAGEINLALTRRVLVVRLDDIGDIVLTTPFLRELRKNLPCARITMIVDPRTYNLVEICPYINEVFSYDLRVARRLGKLIIHLKVIKFAFLHLWKKRFDLAILPRWEVDFYGDALLAYFSGAKKRVAYSEKVSKIKYKANKGHDKLFTNLNFDNSLRHEAEYGLEMINFLGGKFQDERLQLWLDRDDEAFAQSIIERMNIDSKCVLIGMGPGAKDPRKLWPKESFLELIKWLTKEIDSKIVLFGDRSDFYAGRFIEEHLSQPVSDRVINMIGKTTLRQAAALLKYCKLYIGNDTGLVHMAAAMQVPVIQISSWSKSGDKFLYPSRFRFGPWKVRHSVLQPERPISPCSAECIADRPHCILGISVEQAKEAIAQYFPTIRMFS